MPYVAERMRVCETENADRNALGNYLPWKLEPKRNVIDHYRLPSPPPMILLKLTDVNADT